jgi:hypothetical protein
MATLKATVMLTVLPTKADVLINWFGGGGAASLKKIY